MTCRCIKQFDGYGVSFLVGENYSYLIASDDKQEDIHTKYTSCWVSVGNFPDYFLKLDNPADWEGMVNDFDRKQEADILAGKLPILWDINSVHLFHKYFLDISAHRNEQISIIVN
jgi:hypothetical protein